jgi:hypothetical protein
MGQVDTGISGKVGLVERLFLADRFKLAPASWIPLSWDRVALQPILWNDCLSKSIFEGPSLKPPARIRNYTH